MPITSFFANKILDHMLRNQSYTPPASIYFSIHTGDPTDGSTNEMAVTRVAGSYAAAAGKSIALSAVVPIVNCPLGTVKAFSIWDAISSGNCLWTGWLSGATKAFTGEGTAELVTCPAHSFVADDQVVFYDDGVGTLPAGLAEATLYYVIASGLATDAFKVSATQGGSAVNITATGQGLVAKVTPKTIANAGDTFNLTAAPLSIQ